NDGSCGPVSLKMLFEYYGLKKSERELIKLTNCSILNGTTANELVNAAKSLGFDASYSDNNTWENLYNEVHKNGPVIVDWFSQISGHYSPVYDIYKNEIVLADPEYGFIREMKKNEFLPLWFDFDVPYPKTQSDFFLRRMIVVRPGLNL
ncbi:MAG: cysteine peptidase family C39 domain-containing protein, partial [Candidatus Pacearchaeota archaeon]|nr:cysteine peptidase family C39 domain-containing protein [Candidatus Pacearchaeota archaeon]